MDISPFTSPLGPLSIYADAFLSVGYPFLSRFPPVNSPRSRCLYLPFFICVSPFDLCAWAMIPGTQSSTLSGETVLLHWLPLAGGLDEHPPAWPGTRSNFVRLSDN